MSDDEVNSGTAADPRTTETTGVAPPAEQTAGQELAGGVETNQVVQQPAEPVMSRTSARIFGFLLFAAGVGGSIYLKMAHDSGDAVYTNWITITPIVILYGGAAVIDPRVMQLETGDSGSIHPMTWIAPLLGFIIGIVVRWVLFSGWH